jgi:hypothetical protein
LAIGLYLFPKLRDELKAWLLATSATPIV